MPKTLADIKKSLDHHLGKRLQLKANGGRKKTIERAGVLRETYHAVFVIDLIKMKMLLNAYLIVMQIF